MINIYKTVRAFYDKNKANWSSEREQGFKDCLLLFLTGIEKHPAINAHIASLELKIKLDKLLIKVDNLERSNKAISNVKEHLEIQVEKLKQKSIKSQTKNK